MSKSEAEETFAGQLRMCGHPFEREYRFCKRRYRVDFANPALKVILEINGGIEQHMPSHSSPKGIKRDYAKSNLAQLDGWLYLQVTTAQVTSGEALQLWESAINVREEMPY